MRQWRLYGLSLFIWCLCGLDAPAQTSQKIVIAGTGDSQILLRMLAASYQQSHPNSVVEIPDSVGSSGGVKALAANLVDMARVARPLKPKEESLNLSYRPFAHSPIVCVVHPSVQGIDSLSHDQIVKIYQGQLTHWQELGAQAGKIYPVAREEGDSTFDVLKKKIPGFIDITELRAKVCFTTPETVTTLTQYPGTLGFLPLSMVPKEDLRILSINEVQATRENVAEGRYPYFVPFALVYRQETLTGLTLDFLSYLSTDEACDLMLLNGTFPVAQPQ